ncbi:MAG: geranylgeranylglycerol-phosphate geranylgeranyltransferase [Candidatus Marinimicrobia bacterium]|nr:geranylgeranylglycerol-phosphate geranylgeranyltransferase [Candidatus Neomarinimicrobiota bacterium]
MKTLVAYIRLMRPLNLLQGAIAILVCATLMEQFPIWWKILLTIAVVWVCTGGGNALNDYCDSEIDKINRPKRPIPMGLVSKKGALIFSTLLFISSLLFAIPIWDLQVAIVLGIALLFLITYSLFFKMRVFVGNLIVSLILGMAFLFGTIIFGDILKGIVPFLLAFAFTLIREMVKDMQDVEGDRALGVNTLPMKYGINTSKHLVTIFTFLLMIGAIFPYILNVYGKFYLITVIFTVEIPLLYVIFSIQRDTSATNCSLISSVLKADIFFGLLAIYLGRF